MPHVKKRAPLAIFLMLLVVAQLCLLSFPAAATETGAGNDIATDVATDTDMSVPDVPPDDGDGDRASAFMGELFFAQGGETFRVTDGELNLPFGTGGQEVQYTAAVVPAVYETPNNAIRLVLTNFSSASYLHVKYTYVDETGPHTATHRVELSTYSTRSTCILRTPHADRLVNLTLILPSAARGMLSLYAMESIRVWTTDTEENGTIQSCTYDVDDKSVTVKGSVHHDVMIRATGGTLGLFRLAAGQTVAELAADADAEPLAESAISIGFQLRAAAGDVSARLAQYAVLICMPDGTRVPLADPQYALSDESLTRTAAPATRNDFKGIDTTLTAGAIDANVGSAIVDVYLNRLENERQSGYLYTVENQYFYFDRAYLAELDAAVRSLSGSSCRVYLRFLTEKDGTAQPFAVSDLSQTDSARYGALRADDDEAMRYLYAYTSFLCARYNDTDKGDIAGIIIGSRVDQAAYYNDAGALTLAEYTALYGQTLSVIAATATDISPDLHMIVPVSDGWNYGEIGQTYRTGLYTTELFVESLAAYVTAHGGGHFSLMLESVHNPYGLDNAYFEPINTDGLDDIPEEELRRPLTAAAYSASYVCSDNIKLLDMYLDQYSMHYPSLSDSYFYHWTPDEQTSGNALSASYVYHYYRLFHDSRTQAFFVSFRDKEAVGNTVEFSKIKYLVKYIDTPGGSARTSFALDIFGVSDWSQLISGMNRDYVEHMTLVESSFTLGADTGAVGSYSLFDFAAANSTRGWYAGNHCQSLVLANSDVYGRTLDAVMTADQSTLADYSDIAYTFEHPEILFHAPLMTVTLAVDCENDPSAVFEVKLVLGSEEGCLEAKQVVRNGETVVLTLDTAQFEWVTRTEYLRLSVKTVMGEDAQFTVHLSGITLNSREHDNETLAGLYAAIQRVARGEGMFLTVDTDDGNTLFLLLLLGVAVLCTLIVVLMLGHYQRNSADGEDG